MQQQHLLRRQCIHEVRFTLDASESRAGFVAGMRIWSVVLRSYAGLVSPSIATLVHTAETTEDMVDAVGLNPAEGEASSMLYHSLLHLCKQASFTIVINAGHGNGAVAWRALCRRYDSSISRMKNVSQIQNLLTFDLRGDFHAKLEQFERKVAQCGAARLLRQMPPADTDLKIGIVLTNMEDGPLKVHLLYGIDALPSWDAPRCKIIAFMQAQAASGRPYSPMDVGALGWQEKGGKREKRGGGGKIWGIATHVVSQATSQQTVAVAKRVTVAIRHPMAKGEQRQETRQRQQEGKRNKKVQELSNEGHLEKDCWAQNKVTGVE